MKKAITIADSLVNNSEAMENMKINSIWNGKEITIFAACTVGYLKDLLNDFEDSYFVNFTGLEDTDNDYGPGHDTRGLSIFTIVDFSPEDNKIVAARLLKEQAEAQRAEHDKRQAELKEYKRLKSKFGDL